MSSNTRGVLLFAVIFLAFLTVHNTHPHGFHADTTVHCENGRSLQPIEYIASKVKDGKRRSVVSYDVCAHKYIEKSVQMAGRSKIPYYCVLSVHGKQDERIICSPIQRFYRLSDNAWICAHELRNGDQLLCVRGGVVSVDEVQLIKEPLTVYTLQVKDTHTFLVGMHGIVAHNILLPAVAVVGLSIPFDVGWSCGTLGISLGPVSVVCGALRCATTW